MKDNNFFENFYHDENHIWINTSNNKYISYSKNGHDESLKLEDKSYWHLHRNNCIISIIKRFLPDGVIVDVGGGNGFVTKRILDEGLDAILLEPVFSGALNAKRYRNIPEVICSTLEDAGFNENSLAAIGVFDVLEHIEKDSEFINNIHLLLQEEGLIYLTVPAYQKLWSIHDIEAGHYRRYNNQTIKKILENKFEIVFSSYFFSFLIPAVFIFRALPYYLGYRQKKILESNAEFGTSKNIFVRLLEYLLVIESKLISKCISIPIGTSYLVVAKKIK